MGGVYGANIHDLHIRVFSKIFIPFISPVNTKLLGKFLGIFHLPCRTCYNLKRTIIVDTTLWLLNSANLRKSRNQWSAKMANRNKSLLNLLGGPPRVCMTTPRSGARPCAQQLTFKNLLSDFLRFFKVA